MADPEKAAGPLAVLRMATAQFREYARHHTNRANAATDLEERRAATAKADRNATMAKRCEAAAADLEVLIEASWKRERPAVTADDRKAVFMAGFSMGHQRGFYMETEGGLAIWPDHLPVPPGAEEAWAAVAAAIAKGGVHG